jgi:hypothetical protein
MKNPNAPAVVSQCFLYNLVITSSLAIGPYAYAAIRLETERSCEGLNCRLSGCLSPPVGGEPQSITEGNAAAARSRAFPRERRDLGGSPTSTMADQARSGIPAPGLAFRPHTKKRKHSKAEIAAKLAEADDLVTQGKLQSPDCARARRERHDPASLAQAAIRIERFESNRSDAGNTNCRASRLRRLVTDLLLEQMKLEEASQVGERSMRWAS